jgi:hypothetical protein
MCVNGSCCTGDSVCNIVQWSATAPLGGAGVMTLKPEKTSPMTVRGVPSNLRQGVDPGAPVMLHDGSVLLALYVSPSPAAPQLPQPSLTPVRIAGLYKKRTSLLH